MSVISAKCLFFFRLEKNKIMKPINTPTIPLNDAILRVTLFREQLAASVPPEKIPRAVLIPIDDLLAIIERYSAVDENGNVHNTLQGIRAYFAVKATDKDLDNDITALIVPVNKLGNDVITTKVGVGDDEDDTEIYDFTKPCPSECDEESPLFIP
jgi:hypothetical protein